VIPNEGRVIPVEGAQSESHAWDVALGWPDASEVMQQKARGAYAVLGKLSWDEP
jgi:hypothetical protein